MFITWSIIQSALELGVIYALVALALFLSYSMLNVCDLSTDGCFTLGCAVGSVVAIAGYPILALFAAMGACMLSGFVTAFLQTRLGVESLLAGIIVNTGLYTINICVMGKSTLSLNSTETVFTMMKTALSGTPLADYYKLIVGLLFVALVLVFLLQFLNTRLGLSIRATGDNADMVKSSSINPAFTTTVGLCISGAITGLGGCLLGEYQKSCDINMGSGMVTIALASLIIGETFVGNRGTIPLRAVGVVLGSCLYRVIVAIALRFNLPASALKLVSAIIVAVAIASPQIKKLIDFQQKKMALSGRSFYRLMLFLFAALTVGCCVWAIVLPVSRALAVLLGVLCLAAAVWFALADRKVRGGKVC
ncbi:MAG: ABC transporter permease [Clostridiales bacterium]|nr:ABC transporter permease [Clostridiales bacterium]